jgi:hypothetical protein
MFPDLWRVGRSMIVILVFPIDVRSLARGPDGKFADEDIAKILQDATANPAGQYRARGTPEVLRVVEIMGIEQGRRWGVCTVSADLSILTEESNYAAI